MDLMDNLPRRSARHSESFREDNPCAAASSVAGNRYCREHKRDADQVNIDANESRVMYFAGDNKNVVRQR